MGNHISQLRRLALSVATAALALAPVATRADDVLRLGVGGSTQGFLGDRQAGAPRGDAWARASYNTSYGSLGLGVSATVDGQSDAVYLDGSYANVNFGDWVAGIGAVDRNWSFSPNTSLILSENARPIPSIYLKKKAPSAFNLPVLSWIGPWQAEAMLGKDDHPTISEDVRFFGARLTMEPYPGLQLEAVRTAQFTGGLDAFVDVLVGDTNEGATAAANQMGGFGISYRRGDSRVYLQAIGEDEAGGLPSCYFYLAGAEHRTALAGLDSVVNLELVDTRVEYSPGGWCGPNTAYNNGRHPYTYGGEVMGAPIDSEGKSLDLRVSHDLGSYQIDWGLGHYTINDANTPRNRLSSRRVSGPVAHIGVGAEIRELQVGGRISYQGFDLDKASIAEGISLSLFAERRF